MDDGKEDDQTVIIEKTELKRHLKLFNVVALMVSITGHVAIFMTPGSIMATTGSVTSTIIVWFVGGFFVYSLALCFAELGTIFQRAGGPYLYITLTFGPLPGFLMAWGYIILISGPFFAWASHTTAVYIVKAVAEDSGCVNVNSSYEPAIVVIAALINVLLMYLNCCHLKFIIRVQNFLTAAKMLMIAVIIVAGFYIGATAPSQTFEEPMEGSTFDAGRIALALIIVIFSNGGWQSVTTLTEEIKNPARTLPLAIHITFVFSVGVNFLTFVAYMLVLEKAEIKSSDTIALLFWQRIWPPLIPIVSIAVSLASIGALNTAMMGHSRVLMAAARQRVMPGIMCTLHPTHRTPMVSLFVITCYGLLMLFVGNATKMIKFIGLFSIVMGLFMSVAVLYLRVTKPQLPRPYKAPLMYPILQVIINISMGVLIIYQDPPWMMVGVLIFLGGVPVYAFAYWPKPQCFVHYMGKVTALIQKTFMQVPTN